MSLFFFLGGHDLEMITIRGLLAEHAPDRFLDKGLGWGAGASAYRDQIAITLTRGDTPVLVELPNDLEVPALLVDHHGASAGSEAATALEQVFQLLHLPPAAWSRWLALVAANDRGHVAAMLALGATPKELREVRAADRAAQGITEAEEAEGAAAAAAATSLAGGRLTRVALAHTRTATVADRLDAALGGPGYQNLLIESPGEVNVYGEGALIQHLQARFPQGWSGGELPTRGYFGLATADTAPVTKAAIAAAGAECAQ